MIHDVKSGWQILSSNSQEDYELGPTAKKQLRACCLSNLHEVLRFFCLDLGCQHKQGKVYLSSGWLDSTNVTGHCTSCSICNCAYHKNFLPVYWSDVVSFLEWLTITAKLSFSTADFKVQVSSLLMTSTDWKEIIFDKVSTSNFSNKCGCSILVVGGKRNTRHP